MPEQSTESGSGAARVVAGLREEADSIEGIGDPLGYPPPDFLREAANLLERVTQERDRLREAAAKLAFHYNERGWIKKNHGPRFRADLKALVSLASDSGGEQA